MSSSAKQLFQLAVFGFMNGYYSLRRISAACRYDIRMMVLLQGKKAPSHERLGDFIRNRLAGDVMDNLFYQLVEKLLERGHMGLIWVILKRSFPLWVDCFFNV